MCSSDLDDKSRDDVRRDFVLYGEDVGQLAVIAFGPNMVAGHGFNELSRNPQPLPGFSHAAFQYELVRSLLRLRTHRTTLLLRAWRTDRQRQVTC